MCEEEPDVLKDMERLIHEFHDNEKCIIKDTLPRTCDALYLRCQIQSWRCHATWCKVSK